MGKFIMQERALNHVHVNFDEIRVTGHSVEFWYKGQLIGTKLFDETINFQMGHVIILGDLEGKFKVDIPTL